jgi:CheY-like chemotaxis protein
MIMKPKLLEAQIRRYQVFAACDEQSIASHPVCIGTTAAIGALPQPFIAKTKRKALLLVSDDASLGQRLISTAEMGGLVFTQSNDPANALRLAGQDCPAAVFLDLDLPALAGWEAAEEFLQNGTYPSLILLTGRTGHLDLSAAVRAGAVVSKSASPGQLLEKANRVLAETHSDRLDQKARQLLLLRWLRPYDWPMPEAPENRFWGINE